MSRKIQVGGNGLYESFGDLMAFYQRKRKECPKGVSLKWQQGTQLKLQFTSPTTGKRTSKTCGTSFTEEGIIEAVAKAHKVREALDSFSKVSEFWQWYGDEILGINTLKNDLKTYREIFKEIEDKYFNGRHRNTKRKRSRAIASDISSFNSHYGVRFKRFSDWDKVPDWDEMRQVLYHNPQGTKSFKDSYRVIKAIARKAHNVKDLLSQLDEIDPSQTEYAEKQSISLSQYTSWRNQAYERAYSMANRQQGDARLNWLWVTDMAGLYGLRPSEIAAAQNLTQPYQKDGVTVPAINDPNNKELLLVIGEFTYFGASVKTGERVINPISNNSQMIDELGIRNIRLPIYKPRKGVKPGTIVTGFNQQHRARLISMKCPITQVYALRHLYNQLGEMYGIPQEIRARAMGHSVQTNDSVYKRRSNFKTSIDILTKHSKQPLSYEAAIEELIRLKFDTDSPEVKAILRVIYRLTE
ncbi:MAG: recombinase [Microcoleaceae cyanobacterium]